MKTILQSLSFVLILAALGACQKNIEKQADINELSSSVSTELTLDEVTPPPFCGQLHTQSQGGWGTSPSGNNPGTYLHANFAAAFPEGLKVGCVTGKTITLTNAQAVTNLLPTGGTPSILSFDYTDPSSRKNVLIGQLVALTLSAGFDIANPDFGEAGITLGNMIIGSGAFAGKTVNEFLVIGNNVLGGCSDAYSPAEINVMASTINSSFLNGNTNTGFLVCPPPNER